MFFVCSNHLKWPLVGENRLSSDILLINLIYPTIINNNENTLDVVIILDTRASQSLYLSKKIFYLLRL